MIVIAEREGPQFPISGEEGNSQTKNEEDESRGGGAHEHSPKAQRMAEHIEESEEKRGVEPERAKEIAWRTVHKDLPHEEREEKEGQK